MVTRLASSGTVNGGGTGNTVYSSSFLVMMVPHAIITVSLATAMLPRLSGYATDAGLAGMGRTLGSTLRTALVVILPFAALLPILAPDIAGVLFGTPAPATRRAFAPTLALFGPGARLLHRPLPDAARLLRPRADPPGLLGPVRDRGHQHRRRGAAGQPRHAPTRPRRPWWSPGWRRTSSARPSATPCCAARLGGLETPALVRFLVRMAVGLRRRRRSRPGASSWRWPGWARSPGILLSLLRGGLAGLAGVLVLLGAARLMRIREVTSLVDSVVGRVRRA